MTSSDGEIPPPDELSEMFSQRDEDALARNQKPRKPKHDYGYGGYYRIEDHEDDE